MKLSFVSLALAAAPVLAHAQAPNSRGDTIAIIPAPDTKLPRKLDPKPTSAPITAQDLMSRLYIFADDSMQGREAGTIGNVKGTDYIAAEARRIGLVPAGENGGYFQTLPFKTRQVDPASTISVNGASLAFGSEWAALGATGLNSQNLQVVYGGSLADTASLIKADAAAGKLVVFTPGPALTQRTLRSAGRYAASAAGVALVVPQNVMAFVSRPQTFIDDPDNQNSMTGTQRAIIFMTPATAQKLFDSSMNGMTVGTAGRATNVALTVKTDPVPFPARNVIGIIPGSDPKLKGQYVAIGAHNDHVGFNTRPIDHDSIRIFNHIVRPGGAEDGGKMANATQQAEVNRLLAEYRAAHPGSVRQDSIFNGADDDGSGSVTVLEIAEKLAAMKTKPKRSIIFVWHVGEEKGLLGSAWFTDHPTVPRDSIVAQLNMDMVGRGNAWDVTGQSKEGGPLRGNPNYLQLVGSRRLSKELGDIVESVNTDGRYNFIFDYAMDANGHPMNIYCRSDHYEYARYGIPIVFFTTGGHSDYHQVTDEPQYIDYDHMSRVGNLVSDIALKVAGMDHRVVVDAPKPDPKGSCKQ